eukprot:15349875-Ditylum_brightwellii.AAC.1
MKEDQFPKGHHLQGRDIVEQGCKIKHDTPKDITSKEEILQRKDGRLLVDGEVKALLHSCKKPGSPNDITANEEILQSKDDRLLVDGE